MSRSGKQNFDPYHKWLGIRKKRGTITHYDLLGISIDEDDIEVIKSAAEQRMQFVESKRGEGHDSAVTTVLNLLQEAEMTLLDREMRRDYDRSMNLFHKRSKRRQVDPYPNRSQVKSRRRPSRGNSSPSVGEDSGIVGTTIKVLAVFMIGFGIMAWFSFQLPWDKSTTSSEKSELVEIQNIPADISVSKSEPDIDTRPLDSMKSITPPDKSTSQTSSEMAAKELSIRETKVVQEKTSQKSTDKHPKESPASSSPKIVGGTPIAKAPKKSQEPGKIDNADFVPLFNGKNLQGWKALDNKKTDGWGVKNGELILVSHKGTPSLVSEDKFDDFEFECEFWLDKKSNSGIFLRGRYELQLLDDGNYQNLPLEIKCGAIHGQLPPSRAVYRGPNRWNTLSVRLERKTVTVVLNGMKIIDHRYINKVSNGAIDDLEDQQGPIVLQSHSGSARFKNIRIRRLAR